MSRSGSASGPLSISPKGPWLHSFSVRHRKLQRKASWNAPPGAANPSLRLSVAGWQAAPTAEVEESELGEETRTEGSWGGSGGVPDALRSWAPQGTRPNLVGAGPA